MRRWLWGLILPCAAGCLVDNSIADDNTVSSPETRVADRETDFCETVCDKMASCPATPECVCDANGDNCTCYELPDQATCVSDCGAWVEEQFLGQGEECAAAGERVMDCFSNASCEDLTGESGCALTAEEEQQCRLGDTTNPPTPTGAHYSPVTCQLSSGSGSAGGAAVQSCEQNHLECSDGVEYSVSCMVNGAGTLACSCFANQIRVTTFTSPALECPSTADINVGCGFWLAEQEVGSGLPDPTVPVVCNGAAGGGGPVPGSGEWGCMAERGGCEDGHSYMTDCSLVDGVPTCNCVVDGAVQSSFHVFDGACPGQTGSEEEFRRINAGCGWYLQ